MRRNFTGNGEVKQLPFENDSMLSIILSKAFLLASDRTINDPLIISQIQRNPIQ